MVPIRNNKFDDCGMKTKRQVTNLQKAWDSGEKVGM